MAAPIACLEFRNNGLAAKRVPWICHVLTHSSLSSRWLCRIDKNMLILAGKRLSGMPSLLRKAINIRQRGHSGYMILFFIFIIPVGANSKSN